MRKGKAFLLTIGLLGAVMAGGFYGLNYFAAAKEVEHQTTSDGTKIKFRTEGETIQMYRYGEWQPMFVKGVNLGVTLPGHFPSEFPLQREDYLRWFGQIKEMGANVIRVYTRHNPVFYSSLVEYNQKHADDPLYFIQGIWSPEEQLIEKKDAYLPEIQDAFRNEIERAVKAVYGDLEQPESPGQSSGTYKKNAGPYLLGWHIGTEWDPEMVLHTNETHKDKAAYTGRHFQTEPHASPFEAWLTEMMDHTARAEKAYGWEHPVTFTNWVTTDVLSHPEEPLYTEDRVSVDATHIRPLQWEAGYFAAYHVYPYYPDFFRFDKNPNQVKDANGQPDSYRTYLQRLKAYHRGMPLMVTEYGVPSSAGISHFAPLNRSQGGHNEEQQGRIDAELTRAIHDEGYAGAILFMWQDEWFKKTWNTMPMEIPADRRPYWLNVLTNEKQFGVLGMYSGKDGILHIDGKDDDWRTLRDDVKTRLDVQVPGIRDLWATHDEAYVYLAVRLDYAFDPKRETLFLGTDILPGGNKHAPELNGKVLDEGLETLITIGTDEETGVRIAANYDMQKRLYGYIYGMLPVTEQDTQDDSGVFSPWRLPVSLKMEPPDTKFAHPFEDAEVGRLPRGTTDPQDPSYNSLAMWQYSGDFIELRIPWMLLGLADPSSLQAVSYDMPDKVFKTAKMDGIRFIPWFMDKSTKRITGLDAEAQAFPVSKAPRFTWSPWDTVTYTERLKQSYTLMQSLYRELER